MWVGGAANVVHPRVSHIVRCQSQEGSEVFDGTWNRPLLDTLCPGRANPQLLYVPGKGQWTHCYKYLVPCGVWAVVVFRGMYATEQGQSQ